VARIVCQVLHRPDRVTFIWSQGAASFAPYHLIGERAEIFRNLGREARERLADVATHGSAAASGLAQVGWRLYQAIFPREPLPAEVQAWLSDLRSKNEIESLEIVSDLPGSTPWNVIHEQAPDEVSLATGQPAAFQPFWGVRYPLTAGRRVNTWRQVPFLESPVVLLAADPGLLQSLPEEQRSRLTNLARDKDLQLIDSRRSLEAAFQEQTADFLYVFARAHGHGFMLGQDVVSLSEFRDLVQGGDAEPLVFLNVTHAGGADRSGSQLGHLLAMGLDGIIATEQPGPAAEGYSLGLELLGDFVYGGKTLGAALQTLRARSGLAGLLLSSSCPAHLRIVWDEAAGERISSDESDSLSPLAAQPSPLPDYPYRPLAPYDREDRALSAGRDQDVADFVSRLDRAETRLLILHGVSGVGKASFLHAGVVPYLEDEAVGFQALRDRTPEDEPQDEKSYPVIAIRATHDLAGQLAEALCAFCSQPYQFTSPTGKTTSVDLPGILHRLIGAKEQGASLSTAVRELGPQDQIQPAGGGLSGPPPLPPSEDGREDEETTPPVVWEALQNDPGLLARLLAALSEPLPCELVMLIEQGEEIFTQATRPVDRRRRRQALDMLGRAGATSSQCKVIYSLRTEFLGRLLDEMPALANGPTFLLGELDEDHVVEAILLPTVTEPIPYALEIPQQKYRFSYGEGMPQTIVRNAREAGNGSESLLPRVQAICAQLYDALGDREDRVIGEPLLKVLGKGESAFRLGSYLEKKLTFLPQRSDRRKFVELLQHFYRREPDGTVVRNLLPLADLSEHWRGSVPLNAVMESAAAENVRIFELNQLLIGGKESLYVSLSQDALAQAAVELAEDRRRVAYGRSKMVDMLWVFIPLLFLVAVIVFVVMRSGTAASGQDSFPRDEVQKLFRDTQKQFLEQAALLGYSGRMSLANQALQSEDTLRARQSLLTQQAGGKGDLRGFEWFYLWRRAMQEERSFPGHNGLVTSVAVAPDGKTVASASFDGTVKLWDVSGLIRATFEGHSGPVHAVAFSGDGKTLASGGEDKTVRLWDVTTGKEYAVIKKARATLGHQGAVLALAFAREGLDLVSGGRDKTIILWNVAKGEKEREYQEHAGPVLSLAFAPDGKTLASGGGDHLVYIWDKSSGKPQALKGHAGSVHAVAFSPDGERLASGAADTKDNLEIGTVRIWDAKTGKLAADNIQHAPGVFTLAFGPGGKTLFTGGKDNSIRVWDAATGQGVGALQGHLGWVRTLALSSDASTLVSGSYDQSVKVWAPAGALQANVLNGHKDWVCSVAFSANDKVLASAGRDGTVRLWDADRGVEIHKITGLDAPLLAVALTPSKGNPKLAAGTWNSGAGEIKIWELTVSKEKSGIEAKELHTLKGKGGIACLAFSHDGKTLASGGADRTAILWDVASGKEKHVLKGHQGALRTLGFSFDDRLLATAGDDKVVRVWDANSGKETRPPLQGHSAPITALGFLPKDLADTSEDLLVTTGYDQTIRIWAKQSKGAAMLRGHAGPVLSLALDLKTGSVFTGSWDRTIKVWKLRPGADERFTFTGHAGPVRGLALSHDGRTLASASHDGTVRLWRTAESSVLGPDH
jgi:WD40 repeat protein